MEIISTTTTTTVSSTTAYFTTIEISPSAIKDENKSIKFSFTKSIQNPIEGAIKKKVRKNGIFACI